MVYNRNWSKMYSLIPYFLSTILQRDIKIKCSLYVVYSLKVCFKIYYQNTISYFTTKNAPDLSTPRRSVAASRPEYSGSPPKNNLPAH